MNRGQLGDLSHSRCDAATGLEAMAHQCFMYNDQLLQTISLSRGNRTEDESFRLILQNYYIIQG